MLEIDRAAIKLYAVIRVTVHLDVVHLRAATDSHQGYAINFVTGGELVTTLGNHHVAQHAAAVLRVVATGKSGFALGVNVAVGAALSTFVVGCVTVNNQTTPFSRTLVTVVV